MTTFSLDAYRHILELGLREGYEFRCFSSAEVTDDAKVIFLRHDVDYSPAMAVEMARVNASLGISGTFCVLLRSQVYNLLSYVSLADVRALHCLGQQVALHYALPEPLPSTDGELRDAIRHDFEVVRRDLPELQAMFAWHNTTPEIIERGLDFELPGFVNVYSRRFFDPGAYFSDTNLRNSPADFERILLEGKRRLQLLFHPFNWVAGGSTMVDVLSATWVQVIRDREREMGRNRSAMAYFPEGIPTQVLEAFRSNYQDAAEASLLNTQPALK